MYLKVHWCCLVKVVSLRHWLFFLVWEVDHRQEASTLALLRSDSDSLQEVLSSCAHREQTVDGDTAIRPFIVIIPQQPLERKIQDPNQFSNVRNNYLPSENMWSQHWFSAESQNTNPYCRVKSQESRNTVNNLLCHGHCLFQPWPPIFKTLFRVRSGPHACNLTSGKAEAEGWWMQTQIGLNNETLLKKFFSNG